MWLGFVTLFPELIDAGMQAGVVGRAISDDRVSYEVFDLRGFTRDKHRTVDDRPYGGGAGMVLMYEPLQQAIQTARDSAPPGTPVVLMSPQGKRVDQALVTQASESPGYILVCGRYEGLDERVVANLVDEEWSLGDFVLSGGEIPALAVADAMIRLLPGVLGNRLSIIDESFLDDRLDYPHYTRPEQIDKFSVPQVLMSGDHRRIAEYRRREALTKTYSARPDLLTQKVFSPEEATALRTMLNEQTTET